MNSIALAVIVIRVIDHEADKGSDNGHYQDDAKDFHNHPVTGSIRPKERI